MKNQESLSNTGNLMRSPCVQDKQYGYIFNAFSDGEFQYKNNNEGQTFRAMQQAGRTDPAVQRRVNMFRFRSAQ
jgi:N-sulfoglucosamine sulfohydrolase